MHPGFLPHLTPLDKIEIPRVRSNGGLDHIATDQAIRDLAIALNETRRQDAEKIVAIRALATGVSGLTEGLRQMRTLGYVVAAAFLTAEVGIEGLIRLLG